MIFTSRYSNQELKKGRYYPVGISVGKPRFALGYNLRGQSYLLAPRYDMLNLEKAQYTDAYFSKLDAKGEEAIIRHVRSFEKEAWEEGKDLVLLCFEDIRKPDIWCHRTLFSEWWFQHTGERIEELGDPSPAPKNKRLILPSAAAEPERYNEQDQMCLF